MEGKNGGIIPICIGCNEKKAAEYCRVCNVCKSRSCAFGGKGDGCNYCHSSGD